MPTGLTFKPQDNGTASLAGTPTQAGKFALTVAALRPDARPVEQQLTLVVTHLPVFTTSSAASFLAGSAADFTVRTSGYPAPLLRETGGLPTGLTFVPGADGTAVLTGKPSQSGTFSVTVEAVSPRAATVVQHLTLVVLRVPVFTSPSVASFLVGSVVNFTVSAIGYPAPVLRELGGLPAGLVFAARGAGRAVLAGRPTETGTFPVTVVATSGNLRPVEQHLTVVVTSVPTFTTAKTDYWRVGENTTFNIHAAGSPAPRLREVDPLPPGLTFTDRGGGNATLSGTPTTPGTYRLVVRANNGSRHITVQHLTIVVTQPAAMTSPAFLTWPEGKSQRLTVTATGYPEPKMTESGPLPPGVIFEPYQHGTAYLAGAPTQTGVFHFTLTANSKASPPAEQQVTLVIVRYPAITTPTSVTMPEGHADSFSIDAIGYPTPKLQVIGALPAGLVFKDNGNGTGALAGTPTASGTFSVEVVATNSIGVSRQYLMLSISTAPTKTTLTYGQVIQTRKGVTMVLTATVDPGSGTPTGSVTFLTNPSQTLGTATLNPAGVASLTVHLRAGRHTLVANYQPKAGSGFAASSSQVISYRAVALPAPPKGKKLVASEKGLMGQSVTILELLAGFMALAGVAGAIGMWGARRHRGMSG